MNKSETISKIAVALVQAQTKMGNAIKDSKNPFFKSKYADLNAVREACLPALNESKISVLQLITNKENKNYVETILLHESGEWISSETEIKNSKPNDPQAEGSGITYARRYGLQSIVCLGAEDDDGNAASNNNLDTDNKDNNSYQKKNTKQQDINKIPIPETKPEPNQNFNYKPSETVNWINTKTKKPVPEKTVYNAITKAFLAIYENENLNKENKAIKVLEIVQTYIETFEGLTLKENVLKVPYEIILKDIEKL